MKLIKSNQDKWQELQQKLATVEKEFLQVIDSLDVYLRAQKIAANKWSPKEVLSHIVGWEVEVVKQFKTFLTNPDVNDTYDIDSFNKTAVEERKHLDWNMIIAELKNSQEELSIFLNTLTQKEIDREKRFVEWVDVLINHYVHHTKQLKQLSK